MICAKTGKEPAKPRRRRGFKILSDRSGIAYIEFAYSLPILMLVSVYGLELANIAITHARVSNLASMMTDGAARVRDSIDEADINELFLGAKMTGQGIAVTTHGRIIISTVEDNAATPSNTTDQIITWQRCKGLKVPSSTYGTEGAVLSSGIGPVGRQISAKPGNPVIFTEVIYTYQPLVSNRLFGPMEIRYSSAFSVRDRVLQTMQNGGNLPVSQKATCNYFTA